MKPHSYKLHELREIFRLFGEGKATKEISAILEIPAHRIYYAVRHYGSTDMASDAIREGSPAAPEVETFSELTNT